MLVRFGPLQEILRSVHLKLLYFSKTIVTGFFLVFPQMFWLCLSLKSLDSILTVKVLDTYDPSLQVSHWRQKKGYSLFYSSFFPDDHKIISRDAYIIPVLKHKNWPQITLDFMRLFYIKQILFWKARGFCLI